MSECEGTLKDHGVKSRVHAGGAKNQTVFLRALSKHSLSSGRVRCRARLPVERVPVSSYLVWEEPFPKSQPDRPLSQLHAVPWGPVAVPREESSAPAPLLPHEGAVGRHEATPPSPLLLSEGSEGPHLLLTRLALWTFDSLRFPPLEVLQWLYALVLWYPEV